VNRPTALATALAPLAPIVAELVRSPEVAAALREALGGAAGRRPPYTNANMPAGYKLRAFLATCRTVAELGAVKPAGTRSWSVDADRWDAWAAKATRRGLRRRDVKPGPCSTPPANDATSLAASFGLERRRGAA
jgi:hypothetical protein